MKVLLTQPKSVLEYTLDRLAEEAKSTPPGGLERLRIKYRRIQAEIKTRTRRKS